MNVIKRVIIALALIIISAFVLYAFSGAESDKIRLSDKEILTGAGTVDESIFISSAQRSEMKKITASGMLEMYLDEKTMVVCIYDKISGKLYRSLPEKYTQEKTSALSLHMIIEGGEYILSSQQDSLGFGCTEYEVTDRGVTVTYSFRRSFGANKKLDVSVPVSYELVDGALSVKVNCDHIYNGTQGKAKLCGIELLPYFCADSEDAKGDYLLLSEGSGAIVDLSEKAESFDEISLKVYGEDPAVPAGDKAQVLLGAFGRKWGEGAFVCLVNQGDTICEIRASKALKSGGYNRVGAYFALRPTLIKDDYIYVAEDAYQGEIELCYRFLGTDNADYTGMAAAVREQLIRNGDLSEKVTDEKTPYSFNLTLVMSENTQNKKGEDILRGMTSFSEGYELLASLKAKGFENINVYLDGIYTKGTVRTVDVCGDKNELERFAGFAENDSISLFAETEILCSAAGNIRTIDSEKLEYSSFAGIEKKFSELISSLRKQNFIGAYVSDGSKILLSDYSGANTADRLNVKNSLFSFFASLSASKKLAVDSGNLYSIKYADNIINLPDSSSLSENEYISDVPFIQAVLHGISDYCLEAANISRSSTDAMLRAIEFGAMPHYQWHCLSPLQGGDEERYYMNSIAQAQAYYEKMKNDFSTLRSRRITEHEKIKEDLYLTQFGEDCRVYVNYSEKPVTVEGVTVDGKSYALVAD